MNNEGTSNNLAARLERAGTNELMEQLKGIAINEDLREWLKGLDDEELHRVITQLQMKHWLETSSRWLHYILMETRDRWQKLQKASIS